MTFRISWCNVQFKSVCNSVQSDVNGMLHLSDLDEILPFTNF